MSKPNKHTKTTALVTTPSASELAANGPAADQMPGLSIYKDSARFLGPLATAMRSRGLEYAKLKLIFGLALECIAQSGQTGALNTFVKMAVAGQLESEGFPRMARSTLFAAKDYFKQAAKASGLALKDAPALRDSMLASAGDNPSGALERFTSLPGNAGEVAGRLLEWVETSGTRSIDEAMAEQAAAKFAGGGGGGSDDNQGGNGNGGPPPGGDGKGGISPLTDAELNLLTAHGGVQATRAFMANVKAWHELPVSECPEGCVELQFCSHTLNALDALLEQFRDCVQAKVTAERKRRR